MPRVAFEADGHASHIGVRRGHAGSRHRVGYARQQIGAHAPPDALDALDARHTLVDGVACAFAQPFVAHELRTYIVIVRPDVACSQR